MKEVNAQDWKEFRAWRESQYQLAMEDSEYKRWQSRLQEIQRQATDGIQEEKDFFGLFKYTVTSYPDANWIENQSGMAGMSMNNVIGTYVKYGETIEGFLTWIAEGKK